MTDDFGLFGVAVFVLVVGFVLGGVAGGWFAADKCQSVVIEHGYGLYCPTDGKFAFIGECGDATARGETP